MHLLCNDILINFYKPVYPYPLEIIFVFTFLFFFSYFTFLFFFFLQCRPISFPLLYLHYHVLTLLLVRSPRYRSSGRFHYHATHYPLVLFYHGWQSWHRPTHKLSKVNLTFCSLLTFFHPYFYAVSISYLSLFVSHFWLFVFHFKSVFFLIIFIFDFLHFLFFLFSPHADTEPLNSPTPTMSSSSVQVRKENIIWMWMDPGLNWF